MDQFPLQPLAKILIFLGAGILILGLILFFFDKAPMIGKLPGDIVIRRKNFTFYFPLTSLIILNLVLWMIFWIIGKIKGQ